MFYSQTHKYMDYLFIHCRIRKVYLKVLYQQKQLKMRGVHLSVLYLIQQYSLSVQGIYNELYVICMCTNKTHVISCELFLPFKNNAFPCTYSSE